MTPGDVLAALREEGGVDAPPAAGRRKFGDGALKVGGKIFAMVSRDALVVKLPRRRVEALVASGAGRPYDPGSGRVMKEWVALDGASDAWLPLAREAREFVRGG